MEPLTVKVRESMIEIAMPPDWESIQCHPPISQVHVHLLRLHLSWSLNVHLMRVFFDVRDVFVFVTQEDHQLCLS